MSAIQHVRNSFYDWLRNDDYFRQRRSDIAFIGFQESLDHDFERLKHMLALPADLRLPTDEVSAHRNPLNIDRRMSAIGAIALKRWYRDDIRLWHSLKP